VQGSGFNWKQPDHFRMVFLPNVDDLAEAISRIAQFLERYRSRSSDVLSGENLVARRGVEPLFRG
jgi:hypothetical protein